MEDFNYDGVDLYMNGIHDGALPSSKTDRERMREIIRSIVVTLNHEINQHLCSVIGYPDLIRDGNLDPETLDSSLRSIKDAGESIKYTLVKISAYLGQPLSEIKTKPYLLEGSRGSLGSESRLLAIDFDAK